MNECRGAVGDANGKDRVGGFRAVEERRADGGGGGPGIEDEDAKLRL